MLYTLNFCIGACQLYLNKTGKIGWSEFLLYFWLAHHLSPDSKVRSHLPKMWKLIAICLGVIPVHLLIVWQALAHFLRQPRKTYNQVTKAFTQSFCFRRAKLPGTQSLHITDLNLNALHYKPEITSITCDWRSIKLLCIKWWDLNTMIAKNIIRY